MKKLTIAVVTLLCLVVCNQNVEAQMLPASEDRTFEITMSPFAANPVSFTEFKMRMFQSEDMALRVRADLNYSSNRVDEDERSSQFYIMVAPGVEYHTLQSERLSVYYGGELGLQFRTSRVHMDDVTNKNVNNNDLFGIGVNAFAGLDIYFLERLYTGVEVGYGLTFISYLDAEINDNVMDDDRRDITLNRNLNPRFRFGIKF